MTKKGEKFYTMKEFKETFVPDLILDRLEEEMCKKYDLVKGRQSRLIKHDNPRTGLLVFERPMYVEGITSLASDVEAFYQGEGYKVDHEEGDRTIFARRGEEDYWIYLADVAGELTVAVTESLIDEMERVAILGG